MLGTGMGLCQHVCTVSLSPTRQPSTPKLNTSQVNQPTSELGGNGRIYQNSVDGQSRAGDTLKPAEPLIRDRRKGARGWTEAGLQGLAVLRPCDHRGLGSLGQAVDRAGSSVPTENPKGDSVALTTQDPTLI